MSKDKAYIKNRLQERFKHVFEYNLIDEISINGIYATYEKGDYLVDIGDNMTHIPLIIKGLVKVFREDKNEDEILLYFLDEGSTCAISFVNCINQSKSMFRAYVEDDTECILIPVTRIEDWMTKYKSWREFIIDSYHLRMLEMSESISSLAFLKLDTRLVQYLQNQVSIKNSNLLTITHQEIANDLHTSRVVISRLLKSLENEEKIELGRNKIKVLF